MKIYVGMALTQAPQEFREDFQKELKDMLRSIEGVEVMDFVGLQGSTAGKVYSYDRNCTETADLCVFIADYPSIGLGMEIMIRHFAQKPMLVCARANISVTRMLTGMCIEEDIQYFSYTTVVNIVDRVKAEIK